MIVSGVGSAIINREIGLKTVVANVGPVMRDKTTDSYRDRRNNYTSDDKGENDSGPKWRWQELAVSLKPVFLLPICLVYVPVFPVFPLRDLSLLSIPCVSSM